MDKYYVNRNPQPGGEHEVHKEGCSRMPDNPRYLGYFSYCWNAIKKAKDYYTDVDGCYYCCKERHTK